MSINTFASEQKCSFACSEVATLMNWIGTQTERKGTFSLRICGVMIVSMNCECMRTWAGTVPSVGDHIFNLIKQKPAYLHFDTIKW